MCHKSTAFVHQMLPTGSDGILLMCASSCGSPLPMDAGMVNWAHSRDPILQRYGVGGVARAAIASGAGLAAVVDAGGLKALVSALSEDDPQAQCFAAAALGEDFCLRSLASSWRCLGQSSSQTCSFICSGHHQWRDGLISSMLCSACRQNFSQRRSGKSGIGSARSSSRAFEHAAAVRQSG